MGRKIGMGVGSASGLGRKIYKYKTEFVDASWAEIGRRFGVHPDHARTHYRVAEEFSTTEISRVGVNKLKAIIDGKVPLNHRRAFLSIATMAEWTELRRLIHRLYGDPKLREQISEFPCIVCGKAIPFERMATMQCSVCDGEKVAPTIKINLHVRGELCLA